MPSEKNIQNASLLAIGCRRDCMVWRNHTGVFKTMDESRTVVVGTPGAADSLGVVAVTITPEMIGRVFGVALAVEFKTDTGRQSQKQKNWQEAFTSRGGIYRIVRSPDEMLTILDDVKHGRF